MVEVLAAGPMMARIRSIKPSFFRHVHLFEAEKAEGLPLRVAFAGLWTAADREGRFKWEPRDLKLDCLPHDDVDFSRVLDALTTRGFIVQYQSKGRFFGYIPSWHDHQSINNRESPSVLPSPEKSDTSTRASRVEHASTTRLEHAPVEGKGREGKEISTEQVNGHHLELVAPKPTPPPIAQLPLLDGSEFGVTATQAAEWSAAFPAVDVATQLRRMRIWLHDNPTKRKTKRGVGRFVFRWLESTQNQPSTLQARRPREPVQADPTRGYR